MSADELLIITTRLSPQICGIGTYSWLLLRHWPRHLAARFLVIDGAEDSRAHLNFERISEFAGDARALTKILERHPSADVLLHYAGRAYHRYGCPLWLPRVLRRARARGAPARQVAVFFHELPGADFSMTSRFFWIDKCNSRVIRQLCHLADTIATNTAAHASILQKISGRTDATVIPVGSNIEPLGQTADKAPADFAIFGLPFGRCQTLQLFQKWITEWQCSGRLARLHLIGPNDNKFDRVATALIKQLPRPDTILQHGQMSPADVSRLLSTSAVGLTNATKENWSKSTTFMAYAAHRCAIVGNMRSDQVPLNFVLSPEDVSKRSPNEIAASGGMLRDWYDNNAHWARIANKAAALFSRRPEKVLA